MTRKQERKRRVLEWAAIVAGGMVAAAWLHGVAGAAALTAALWLGHRRMILPPGVAVLTYHSVARDPKWLPWAYNISVAPETLARHLETAARMGCTIVGTRDYLARRAAGTPLPTDSVLLHFDDGYLDNWLAALPILRAHRAPATFFASLDFVEPGQAPRRRGAEPSGYMNWAELRAVEADPLFEVEPHGVDHGRIPLSDRSAGELTVANWRTHAWMQWAATDGPKYDWHRLALPAAVPLGSRVPESGLALASVGVRETSADLEARITRHLALCQRVFETQLDRSPQVFCWPENAVVPEGRRIAASLGYRATTGGRRRNTADEPIEVISRIHMGDRALGFRWLWAEGLHFRAATRLAQGNLYWYAAVGPMNLTRALVTRVRRAMGYA
jgi:peptidoglycan/xylan/chitin deacetylase (PgdA/CDA1 family)